MRKGFTYALLFLLLTTGCEINQKEVLPEDGFLKIYNHPDELLSFFPESVMETSGNGYLFISSIKDENSEIEYPYTYLVRTNAAGVVEWTQTYDWLAPASKLFQVGGSAGFVAMDPQLNAHAVLIDMGTGEITGQFDLEMTAPLYAYGDLQGNLVVLGFDFISRSSWISKYGSDFQQITSIKLPANTDLELVIQRHLNKTGQQFPFFIGEYSDAPGNGYYISCFHNYTFLTAFLNGSSLNPTGDIFSYQTSEAISSMIHKTGSVFGLTGYYEGNNYVIPHSELDINSSQNVRDFPNVQLYQLTQKAGVVNTHLGTDNDDYVLFTSQTNDNAIVTYQYALDSDSLIMTHHRYMDQRVEVADIIQTSDQGTAVLAALYILGKYQRPLLIKEPGKIYIPEEE
jgi:hypothetical protein